MRVMGYYDDHAHKTRSGNKGRRGLIWAGVTGVILGALLVMFSVPFFTTDQAGTAENQSSPINNEETVEESPNQQHVSLNVTSDITEAVDQVSGAVVGVFNLQQSDFWEESGINEGTGSGVIYKVENGQAYIVTNHHVIEGASQVEVSLADETRMEAEIVGSDILTDLAVLRIDGEPVDTVAEFGDSEALRVGEPAIAIGNPLGSYLSSTVTQGIISATERSIPVDLTGDGQIDWHAEVLQTDAAINPGNSGGALININGQLVGINSMKIAQAAVEGIGFSIPTSVAVPVIEDLERYGEVQRPQLGVGIKSLAEIPSYHWQETLNLPEEVEHGVFITSVASNSPAEEAGLQEYDVIVALNGEEIVDGHSLRQFLYSEVEVGDTIEVEFYRNGELQTIEVTLMEEVQF